MLNYGTYATPRADLGAAIQEFRDSQIAYIGLRLLPILRMAKQAATVSVVTRESMMTRVDTKRAPGGAYNRGDFDLEDLAYSCEEHGFDGRLAEENRKKYASDFDAE